jgi:hypothetical protein
MSQNQNFLKEAVLKSPELGEGHWSNMVDKAKNNPWYNVPLKQGILSDIAGALGKMHSIVVEAAKPNLIGRELVTVMPTTEALVRFPKAKLAKAYKKGEFAETFFVGEKYETQDIKCDIEIRAGAEFSKKFFEDASWPVLERQTAEVGRAVADLETKTIYDYLVANAGTTTTGDGDGVFEWAELVKLWNAIKKIDWSPDALALHPDEVADCWTQDQFIHGFYFGEGIDVRRGVLGDLYLGMKVLSSSKCTAATVIALEKAKAVLLVRRELVTEPFENPKEDRYGIVASERIGLGITRTTAVGKLTSI